MSRHAILIVLLLIMGSLKTQAQDTELPNYDFLFTDAVNIVSVEGSVYPSQIPPQVEVDNEARVVRFRDPETDVVSEYPFPSEVESFVDYNLNYNATTGQLILATDMAPRAGSEFGRSPTGEWRLDFNTGIYTQLEMVCGVTRPSPEKDYWLLYENVDTDEIFICNSYSGIVGDALNPEVSWSAGASSVDASPNGEMLAFFGTDFEGCMAADPDSQNAFEGVFIYTLATEEIELVGCVYRAPSVQISWLGDNRQIIINLADHYGSSAYESSYLLDITQPFDIEPMAWDWLFGPNRLYSTSDEAGQSYVEWVTYNDNGCVLASLNTTTGERVEYDLQGLCAYGIPLPSGDRLYYYVALEYEQGNLNGRPTSSVLATMNPYTGERVDIFTGEIESLMDLSEDMRYAVVVLDDSGAFEMYGMQGENSQPHLAIIDLQTGDIIYDMETQWDTNPLVYYGFWQSSHSIGENYLSNDELSSSARVFPEHSLFSIGGDLFMQVYRDDEFVAHYTLVDLRGEQPQETVLDGDVLLVEPTTERLIIATTSGTLDSYSTETHESTPLITGITHYDDDYSKLIIEDLEVGVGWDQEDNRLLSVYIRQPDNLEIPAVIYRIEIP